MTASIDFWAGEDWEAHVLGLLQDEHGAENVQKVPAKHRGDSGLDYFCLAKRIVYQCYAVEEPVGIDIRADKQKTKITTDIGKFCDLTKGAAEIFKNYKIRRWILVVPSHDSKEVNKHAMKKMEEVLAKDLPHVATDFQIVIHDRRDFSDESWVRRAQLRSRIRPLVPDPTDEEFRAVMAGDQSVIRNLRTKLKLRFSEEFEMEEAVDDALRLSIKSDNAVEALRTLAPEAYEDIRRLASQRLQRLRFGSKGSGTGDRLDEEIDGLKSSILDTIPNLDEGTAETIALGTVTNWLMQCPLKLD